MFLIFKRANPQNMVMFNSLDEIKDAIKTEIYGKYNYDDKLNTEIKNDFKDFTIIKNPKFTFLLCNDDEEDHLSIQNIILDISNLEKKTYYLLDEHFQDDEMDLPTVDGKKLIFNNLTKMKKYCKYIVYKNVYFYGYYDNNRELDYKLIEEMINKLELDNPDPKEEINFTIGYDYCVNFTISKIK